MSLEGFFDSLDNDVKLENLKTNLISKLSYLYNNSLGDDKNYINKSIQLVKSLDITNFNSNRDDLTSIMENCNKIYKKLGD
jgi:hypothetical protein